MIVRKAGSKDRKAVLALIRELQRFLDLRPGEVKASERLYVSLLKEQNHLLLVAEEGGKVLGLASLWFRKNLFHTGTCCLLDELIVRKDARGKEVGQALVVEAVLAARRRKAREVEVTTLEKKTKASAFYRKLGFEEMGVLLEKEI
jgi:ribosomal protein S18 acetylase RimI-like enzyme